MVRDFLDSLTANEPATARVNPSGAGHPETRLSGLHAVVEEEWRHLHGAARPRPDRGTSL
jgi:hypothetical protein